MRLATSTIHRKLACQPLSYSAQIHLELTRLPIALCLLGVYAAAGIPAARSSALQPSAGLTSPGSSRRMPRRPRKQLRPTPLSRHGRGRASWRACSRRSRSSPLSLTSLARLIYAYSQIPISVSVNAMQVTVSDYA